MSSLLIYSPKCKHSMDVINFIKEHSQFKQMVRYHNVNTQGIPEQYRSQIKSVPTLLTANGKLLIGSEVLQWFESFLPNEISNCDLGGCSMGTCSLTDDNDNGNDNIFNLENYGQSLQPVMTEALKAKITKNVSDGGDYDDKLNIKS